MADVLRSCAKTGCRWPAAASLSYRYATRQVWLLDLASSPDPSLYDLCPHHADHLVVPKGWERVDDRSAEEIMVEPSAFDRAEQAARRRMTSVEPVPRQAVAGRPPQLVGAGAGAGRNRYAALAEQLPKLAAEQAAHSESSASHSVVSHPGVSHSAGSHPGPAEPESAPQSAASETAASHPAAAQSVAAHPAAAQSDASHSGAVPGPLADRGRMGPTTGAGRPAAPTPAHELAPRAADDMTPAPPAEATAPTDEPLPGQLSIPVDDDTNGVVLQFDLAGGRRRGKST